uniref:Secreted protein n=1 Tax=Laticauda laticaudata TaxID=8630 RepID=A0A8C5STH4_LATLA
MHQSCVGWVGAITASCSLFWWPLWGQAGGTWKAKLRFTWLFHLAGRCAPMACFPSSPQPAWLWGGLGRMSRGPSGAGRHLLPWPELYTNSRLIAPNLIAGNTTSATESSLSGMLYLTLVSSPNPKNFHLRLCTIDLTPFLRGL